MSKARENNEQETLKLDQHFKRILMHVRPYVLNLTSVDEAHLCKIWLDKLNSSISQRNLRNEYLLELSRQLKAGTLKGIFKTQPPNNLLMPLPSSCHAVYISSSVSESDYGRSCQNYLTLDQKFGQRSHLRNQINVDDFNLNTCTNVYMNCRDDKAIERYHSNVDKHHIDVLTAALQNLRIQNNQLKQEFTKCRRKTIDSESFRLRSRVKQLSTRAQIQSLVWKVRVLKKTIAKLRKLNNAVERIYEKKLQHVIKDRNLEMKVLQLQFQGQMSELCLSLYSEKQNELHSLVESLEEKYKALLAAADATIESQQQEYFMKITLLEAELNHLKNPNFGSKPECV